jgi:arylsulfatase
MNKTTAFNLIVGFILASVGICKSQPENQPNVIIIITDDQGYGDLGVTGNPHVKTPNIDGFASESIRLNNFYVSPVCAPTRSSLMTGRYSLRTGVRDTYNGGAIMASNEVTIAEMLKNENYRTGVFGKWHLGDNYPSRPSDQGFDESVIHLSGGMGQVGDYTTYFQGDSSYFDPVLWHNNQKKSFDGYCSDIFTREAINFINQSKEGPFFCYLSFNAPHTPLQVPQEYYNKYKDIDPSEGFGQDDRPFPEMTEMDKEDARKVYAMVDNIDVNIGKLLDNLEQEGIAENTIVIFMTDNGPQQRRYVAGMKGRKGNVYQGGVRVPFYMRYPKGFDSDVDIELPTAHIDVLPTLANMCGASLPNKEIDGKNLLPLILGKEVDWNNRSLFFYWTRRYPELYNNIALRKGGYKLVGKTGYDAVIQDFEMYHVETDPYELTNIVDEELDLAKGLKSELDSIYNVLVNEENLLNPPVIKVGFAEENPIVLNRNDASGQRGIWAQEEIYGKWYAEVADGNYNIKFKFVKPVEAGGRMVIEANTAVSQKIIEGEMTDMIEMHNVYLPKMTGDLIPFYSVNGRNLFPFWMELEKIE